MRKILFILIFISATIISCSTTKKAATTLEPENPPVEEITDDNNKNEVEISEIDAPIYMKTEDVSIAEDEDQSKEGFDFYVIIGSFLKPENAGKFKVQLMNKGFSPVLLDSESGYLRVAVDQTNSETDARKVIWNIMKSFPEYKDIWLLKKK